MTWISEYVHKLFPWSPSESIIFSLANLIYPNYLIKNQKDLWLAYPELQSYLDQQKLAPVQVNDALATFTFFKMERILTTKEYSTLFLHFTKELKESLSENEKYALEQMKKLTLLN